MTQENIGFYDRYKRFKDAIPTIQDIRDKIPNREDILLLIQDKKDAMCYEARMSLLDNLMLRKNAVEQDEIRLNKDQLADDFYHMTGCKLSDIEKIEYRRQRRNEYPINPNEKNQERFPDFILFTKPDNFNFAREGREARILKEIIDIAAPHIIVERR